MKHNPSYEHPKIRRDKKLILVKKILKNITDLGMEALVPTLSIADTAHGEFRQAVPTSPVVGRQVVPIACAECRHIIPKNLYQVLTGPPLSLCQCRQAKHPYPVPSLYTPTQQPVPCAEGRTHNLCRQGFPSACAEGRQVVTLACAECQQVVPTA